MQANWGKSDVESYKRDIVFNGVSFIWKLRFPNWYNGKCY